mmetsp:Transcript_15658/g.40030  ORF Transcript_15658/g.40030 Transcript_15658/m.40030 type:complete len:217 (-) Transcript_15658:1006-1656(-)
MARRNAETMRGEDKCSSSHSRDTGPTERTGERAHREDGEQRRPSELVERTEFAQRVKVESGPSLSRLVGAKERRRLPARAPSTHRVQQSGLCASQGRTPTCTRTHARTLSLYSGPPARRGETTSPGECELPPLRGSHENRTLGEPSLLGHEAQRKCPAQGYGEPRREHACAHAAEKELEFGLRLLLHGGERIRVERERKTARTPSKDAHALLHRVN